MTVVINGSGTITGISTGGLPDGIVDDGTLATSAVTSTKIADGTITNADINASAAIVASKLSGVTSTIKSYAADRIDLNSNISGAFSVYTATGVTFSITSTVANSNFIIHASGWTGHVNPTNNTGAILKLYRKVNSGSYSAVTSNYQYNDYVLGSAAYSWDEMSGHIQLYDSVVTHSVGDVITYQIYYKPTNSAGGYFHHIGGQGGSTMCYSILEV